MKTFKEYLEAQGHGDQFAKYSTQQLKSICERTDPNGDYDDIDVDNLKHRQELIDSIKDRMEGDGYTSFEDWKKGV